MAQWQGSPLNKVTHLWEMYRDGLDYQIKLGLRHSIPTYIDFYEGRQWPPATESTKNLPRPVVNIVKMICRSKKSCILSSPVRILYKSYNSSIDLDKLNSFADYMQRELNQSGLDKLAIDDGIKKGSYFYHYYWDKYASGASGKIEGGVRCEIIDPLNIFFANPHELDEQKQKWILISTRIDASQAEELCDKELLPSFSRCVNDEIQGDDDANEKKITLLTRYFKKDGEVWCERGTKYGMINNPFRLAPCVHDVNLLFNNNEDSRSKGEEACTPSSLKHTSADKCFDALDYFNSLNENVVEKATLYPIVCGYYDKREGSIYGISEVEGIIPNQKAINFNIAMSLLNSQQCAWGKYVALPNALKGQKITNSPGQVLIDYSGTGNGIKRMSEESLSDTPIALSEALTKMTRTFTGATELLSGDALHANMSGVAIAQLQAQAEVPIEELRSNFWEAKKKQGLVLAQFIRQYYYNKEFVRTKRDEHGHECQICDRFSSYEYKNAVLDVVVEPIKGTNASLASDIELLNACLQSGNISFETYIKSYPDGAISNKTSILQQIEAEKNSEIEQLRKELEMYKNQKQPTLCR